MDIFLLRLYGVAQEILQQTGRPVVGNLLKPIAFSSLEQAEYYLDQYVYRLGFDWEYTEEGKRAVMVYYIKGEQRTKPIALIDTVQLYDGIE